MPAHERGAHNPGWVLKVATLATLAFFGVELAAGYWARSLALVSDAWHNLSDALALLITWFACYARAKAPSENKTYGYHRATVLAAFVAALSLVGLAGFLFYQGYRRLVVLPLEANAPATTVMMAMGMAGMLMHWLISSALRRDPRSQPTPRSVLIHMWADAVAALSIVLVAGVIHVTGLRAADPLLGILIAGLIVWTAWDIVTESLNILLEGLPRGMKLEQVATAIRGVPGVEDVHELHIWCLGANTQALSCHVRIPDIPLLESEAILRRVNAVLDQQFRICHTTVQFEHAPCQAANGCQIPTTAGSPHHFH